MTEALLLSRPRKVLEIGTGSDQAAVLAALGLEVYTVERIGELLRQARKRFRSLGMNVRTRHAGWWIRAVRRDPRHRGRAGAGGLDRAARRGRAPDRAGRRGCAIAGGTARPPTAASRKRCWRR
jgi:hypothetical protein